MRIKEFNWTNAINSVQVFCSVCRNLFDDYERKSYLA